MSIDAARSHGDRTDGASRRTLAPPGRRRGPLVRFVLGAVLLVVTPLATGVAPVSANPGFTFEASGVPVTSVGGNGGGPFPRTDCPPGSIATGVRASVAANDAQWATGFSLQCRAIDETGLALAEEATYSAPARGNPVAFVDGSQKVIECPPGQVLTGLQAYATTTPPLPWASGTTPPIITETFPRCRQFDLSDLVPLIEGPTTQVDEQLTAGAPPAEVQLAAADCPDGQFVVGFSGREGWAVDRFEPYCGTLRVGGLSAVVNTVSFAMPPDVLAVVAQNDQGGDGFPISTEAQRVWPGSYSVGADAPALNAAWYQVEPCAATVPHGDYGTCTVQVEGRPDASVTLTGPTTLGERQTAGVVVSVANAGPAASAATVSVDAPAPLTWGAMPAGCSATGGTVTCTVDLPGATAPGGVGGTSELTLSVTAGEGALGTVAVTATVDAPGDGVDSNDAAQLSVDVVEGPPVTTPPTTPPEPSEPRPYRPAPIVDGRASTVVDGVPVTVQLPSGAGHVASAVMASGAGAWSVTGAGVVTPVGDAPNHGSIEGLALRGPVVGIAPRPAGDGYVLVAADGGVFAFGQAPFHGSAADLPLQAPMVAGAMSCSGDGYYLVGADGGVFTYGDARFHGSMANLRLNRPVVGIVPRCDNGGYWLVASDGGVFSFGTAPFLGSLGGQPPSRPIVALAATDDGNGYWLIDSAGTTRPFGSAIGQG